MECKESHVSKHVTVTPVCGRTRHATGCTPQKAEYDQLAERLLGKLGRFEILAKRGRYPDLVGAMGASPVVVALLVVPKENAVSADLSMRLICELKYATAEVSTEDARLRVYSIRCAAFST